MKHERTLRAIGNAALVAMVLWVLWGMDWLAAQGFGDVSVLLGIALALLAGIEIAFNMRDLRRDYTAH